MYGQSSQLQFKQNTISIHCGLQNDFEKLGFVDNLKCSESNVLSNCQLSLCKTSYFWPVLKAVKNSLNIEKNIFDNSYNLVFSSKTAIAFFFTEIFQQNPKILENCKAVYFVGFKSKQYFEFLLPNFSKELLFSSK